jgi:hypothetical protein
MKTKKQNKVTKRPYVRKAINLGISEAEELKEDILINIKAYLVEYQYNEATPEDIVDLLMDRISKREKKLINRFKKIVLGTYGENMDPGEYAIVETVKQSILADINLLEEND